MLTVLGPVCRSWDYMQRVAHAMGGKNENVTLVNGDVRKLPLCKEKPTTNLSACLTHA